MKINIEVDISPEELRRLFGLPDAQPFWDAVNERIANGDSEMLAQMIKRTVGISDNFSIGELLSGKEGEELRDALRTAVGDSFKPSEIVSRFKGFNIFRRDDAEEKAPESNTKPTKKAPAKKKAARKRPAKNPT